MSRRISRNGARRGSGSLPPRGGGLGTGPNHSLPPRGGGLGSRSDNSLPPRGGGLGSRSDNSLPPRGGGLGRGGAPRPVPWIASLEPATHGSIDASPSADCRDE